VSSATSARANELGGGAREGGQDPLKRTREPRRSQGRAEERGREDRADRQDRPLTSQRCRSSEPALAALDCIPLRPDTKLRFSALEGGPLNLGNFRKRDGDPAVDAAGVERPPTPYDLRDTFASNALHAGVTVFELARVMGTYARMIEKHYGAPVEIHATGYNFSR
jgi:hypothetical protein